VRKRPFFFRFFPFALSAALAFDVEEKVDGDSEPD
jgi:hypothetical protein